MLNQIRLCIFVLLISIFVGKSVQALEPPPAGKWWRMPVVTRQLDLTPKQIEELENSFYRHSRKFIHLKKDIESEQFELEILVEAKTLDVERAMAQHLRLEKARTKLATERFSYFLDIRKILGFEKFRRLLELKREYRKRRNQRREK